MQKTFIQENQHPATRIQYLQNLLRSWTKWPTVTEIFTLFDLANWPESVYWLARYTVVNMGTMYP
jgi:hypothetical protein